MSRKIRLDLAGPEGKGYCPPGVFCEVGPQEICSGEYIYYRPGSLSARIIGGAFHLGLLSKRLRLLRFADCGLFLCGATRFPRACAGRSLNLLLLNGVLLGVARLLHLPKVGRLLLSGESYTHSYSLSLSA